MYGWDNPEHKIREDSESLQVQLCLSSESGTLTFPVELSVVSTAVSATGETMNLMASIVPLLLIKSSFPTRTVYL